MKTQNNKRSITTAIVFTMAIFGMSLFAQTSIPHLAQKGSTTQLIVEDKPFLMIAGEIHNSSASTIEFMEPIFPTLKSMNLNAVFVTTAWEQIEPKEGVYDFSLVDAIIDNAKNNSLKVCLLWFASWKNGESSYAPLWVKKDTKRFFRVKTKDGRAIETLSPFCEATKIADAKAFAAMMKHIKAYDKDQTVILMQPENEVGMFQDIDYNQVALDLYQKQVPKELISYLIKNKPNLDDYVKSAWAKTNFKTEGTWAAIFGDTPESKAFFTTWQYATYINFVAKSGRDQYNLPMMVNAWIVQ
uniref:beta-galactosidase n=1 Tax=Flavobacterium sp. TaxID=239 RepID=UPI003750EF06